MKTNSPLISIIIPNYNRESFIVNTLNSISNQTFENWECIVVDDGSTDNSIDLIKEKIKTDPRIKLFNRNQDPKGANTCRNIGLEKSSGEYIMFFDSDDLLKPIAFEKYLNKFTPDIDAVIAHTNKVDADNHNILSTNTINSNNLIRDYYSGLVAFYICGPMWRKSFLNETNEKFTPNQLNLNDWDFNLRQLYHNPKLEYIEDSLIHYLIHERESIRKGMATLNRKHIIAAIHLKKQHLNNIIEKNLVESHIIKKSYRNWVIQLLKSACLHRSDLTQILFKETLKYSIKINDYLRIPRIVFGSLITYSLKRGARII